MQSLIYSNMAFKVKLDCKINANKITCNLNIVSFYIRSVQKALFLNPITFVPTDFLPLQYWRGGLKNHQLEEYLF